MKRTLTKVTCAFVAVLLWTPSNLLADAGVFTGNGQDLHQITSKAVHLVSIDVTIILGRGPFLFDGTVPGMDVAQYRCTFVLTSLSEKDEEVEVGFPVDSEFAKGAEPESPDESLDWVLEYGFIARDADTTYHVAFVHRKPTRGPADFSSVFLWKMHFAPKQTRTLTVQYRIPMSMGLVPMSKDERAGPQSGVFGEEFLNMGQLDMAGYITSTGASWAGNVERAKFTLITEPFEKYFTRRGITEEADSEMDTGSLQQLNRSFPVRHPWWFRRIEPTGWKSIKGGVQWEYTDYKPKDAISIRYYTTPFPRLPSETEAFLSRFLKALRPSDKPQFELKRLREVLLAAYGKEPIDSAVRQFVSQQIWYEPRQDFSADRLTSTQKAILKKFDQKIAADSPK
jgi:hypothetical protein